MMTLLSHAFKRRGFAHCSRRQHSLPPTISILDGHNCCFRANAFSSASTGDGDSKGPKHDQNRVPKTLYRQLLSWCRRYDDVPFNPLPPMTLSSPSQVNPRALKRLNGMRAFLGANEIKYPTDESLDDMSIFGRSSHPAHYAMYKEGVIVKGNMITFPEIRDANELRAVIRSVYWLNSQNTIANIEGGHATDEEDDVGNKEQVSLAFDTIKSCNQLSSGELDSKRERRKLSIEVRQGHVETSESSEFPTVEYHVGQVVKHRGKRWRGVIVGWTIPEDKNDDRLSSLTTKQYSLPQLKSGKQDDDTSNAKRKVQYTVLADLNDAESETTGENTLFGKPITIESQEDLSPVDDLCLQRIHNGLIKQYFPKFDARGHFTPNEILSYMYPLDRFSCSKYGMRDDPRVNIQKEPESAEPGLSPMLDNSRVAILSGVQQIGSRLLLPLADPTGLEKDTDDEASSLVSSLKSAVHSMLVDDKPDTAISSLAKLTHFHVKLNALLWARNANREHKERVNFSLGSIVKHRLYGFRGVVVAWDPKPRMDVRNWDGLKDVENPQEKPFYHIQPDVNDCIRAFGGPRHFRYVCQDNLELISNENKPLELEVDLDNLELSPHENKPLELEVDLDPEEWKWDQEGGRYRPSAEMKFMYAEDFGEYETTAISTIQNLRTILTECMLEIRGGDNNDLFSMNDLFYQLRCGAEQLEDATIVQDFIKEIWKESPDLDLRHQLDNGISQLMEGKYDIALDTFSKIVASDPMYGEAHNKKATVYYMMGEKDNSIKAAEEALKIDHRNFQALAGIGLVSMESSHHDKAMEYFRKCLAIHPWIGTVSSRLFKCMSKKDNSVGNTQASWKWNGP